MQSKMQEMQEELSQRSVTGTSGGGMVAVEADGKGTVKKIKLDPTVVNAADVEMLEDLVRAAVNQAIEKSKELQQERINQLTGGLKLPNLPFF